MAGLMLALLILTKDKHTMAKLITFKAPVQDRKTGKLSTEERRGYVAKLYVGNYQEKFVLQVGLTDDVDCLTHYASGQVVGRLNPIKVRHWSSYSRMTDRRATRKHIREAIRSADDDIGRAVALLNDPAAMITQCTYMQRWALDTATLTLRHVARRNLEYWRLRAFMPGAYNQPNTGDRTAHARWQEFA